MYIDWPRVTINRTELEFLKRLWGLGTGEEEGYRTGPPGYAGGLHSLESIPGPYTRLKIRAQMSLSSGTKIMTW